MVSLLTTLGRSPIAGTENEPIPKLSASKKSNQKISAEGSSIISLFHPSSLYTSSSKPNGFLSQL